MNNLIQGRIANGAEALACFIAMIAAGFGGTMAIMWIWGCVPWK